MAKPKVVRVVDQLYRKPKKDKGVNAPTFQSYLPGQIQQADLLFLPNDGGFKYALVVVDIGSKLTDAEPLKDKKSSNIVAGLKAIYDRKILQIPQRLEVDAGTEFKGNLSRWLKDNNIILRVAAPFRHRQQAMVERRNQLIGKQLFKRMTEQELLTGEVSVQWTDDLPKVIDVLNRKEKKKKKKKPKNEYQCSGASCVLLPEGTKVRVALDAPRDVVSGKRLPGRFRDTDIRWGIKPKTIKQVIIQPNQPPLYLVDDGKGSIDHTQAYTKNQLLPVQKNELGPDPSSIRPIKGPMGEEQYVVQKIVDKKKSKGLVMYLVKWAGYPSSQNTWEYRTDLLKYVPDMVKEFEQTLK